MGKPLPVVAAFQAFGRGRFWVFANSDEADEGVVDFLHDTGFNRNRRLRMVHLSGVLVLLGQSR
jgi:hypothetical protein